MERSVLLEARFRLAIHGNAAKMWCAMTKSPRSKQVNAVVLNLSKDWNAFAIHLKEEPASLAEEFDGLLTHRSQSLGNSIGIRISATFETMYRSAEGLLEDHCLSSVLHIGRSGKLASVQLQEAARTARWVARSLRKAQVQACSGRSEARHCHASNADSRTAFWFDQPTPRGSEPKCSSARSARPGSIARWEEGNTETSLRRCGNSRSLAGFVSGPERRISSILSKGGIADWPITLNSRLQYDVGD
jgi:hypothetical protein